MLIKALKWVTILILTGISAGAFGELGKDIYIQMKAVNFSSLNSLFKSSLIDGTFASAMFFLLFLIISIVLYFDYMNYIPNTIKSYKRIFLSGAALEPACIGAYMITLIFTYTFSIVFEFNFVISENLKQYAIFVGMISLNLFLVCMRASEESYIRWLEAAFNIKIDRPVKFNVWS
jgi:hypothetical protein